MSSVNHDPECDHAGTYPRDVPTDALCTPNEQVLAASVAAATPVTAFTAPAQTAANETVASRPPAESFHAGLAMARAALANARPFQP